MVSAKMAWAIRSPKNSLQGKTKETTLLVSTIDLNQLSWEKQSIVTYKSAGIVVSHSLSVTKGFQQWIRLNNDILDMLE